MFIIIGSKKGQKRGGQNKAKKGGGVSLPGIRKSAAAGLVVFRTFGGGVKRGGGRGLLGVHYTTSYIYRVTLVTGVQRGTHFGG
jgi:hypothetical protein